MAASKGGHDDGIGGNIRVIKSRKGEAFSGIVHNWISCLFANPDRDSLGRDDNPLAGLAKFAGRGLLLGRSEPLLRREQSSFKLGIPRLRLVHIRSLHMAKTPDHVWHARIGRCEGEIGSCEHSEQLLHPCLVVCDQGALGFSFCGASEDVERRPAQAFALRQHFHRLQEPWAEGALLGQARIGVAMAEDRRREMNGKLDIAFELFFNPLFECSVCVEARDLVLVLDRHQLVQIARHGFGEDSRFSAPRPVRRPALCR